MPSGASWTKSRLVGGDRCEAADDRVAAVIVDDDIVRAWLVIAVLCQHTQKLTSARLVTLLLRLP